MNRENLFKKSAFTLALLSLTVYKAGAQAAVAAADSAKKDIHPIEIPKVLFEPSFYLFLLVGILLVAAIITMMYAISRINMLEERLAKGAGAPVARASLWKELMRLLTGSVPVEREHDVLLDHDYDGVRELDNQLPPWWKYGFYFTILFAIVYMINYHVTGTSKLQGEEYNAEMTKAREEKALRMKNAAENITIANVVLLKDAGALADGAVIFKDNCVTCHGNKGQGLVGPNLVDEYWIHGGGIKNVFNTITEGVAGKVMIPWKDKLTPLQRAKVASFILSLHGTNPPGALAPQGTKYTETASADTTKVAIKDSIK